MTLWSWKIFPHGRFLIFAWKMPKITKHSGLEPQLCCQLQQADPCFQAIQTKCSCTSYFQSLVLSWMMRCRDFLDIKVCHTQILFGVFWGFAWGWQCLKHPLIFCRYTMQATSILHWWTWGATPQLISFHHRMWDGSKSWRSLRTALTPAGVKTT